MQGKPGILHTEPRVFYRKSDETKCHILKNCYTKRIRKIRSQKFSEDVTIRRNKQRSKPFSKPSAYRSPACQSTSFVSGIPSSHFCSSTTSARFTLPSALTSPVFTGGFSVITVVVAVVVAEAEVAVVAFVVVVVVVVVVVMVVVVVTTGVPSIAVPFTAPIASSI